MIEKTKDVFVCYNKADKDWSEKLCARIEAESIDGKADSRRISVFFAVWDIDYGENVINRINEGLRVAKHFMPIMSPEFFKSGWTNFEWTHIVSGDPLNIKKRIIPILLRNVSVDGTERISLPAPFRALKYFDFTNKQRFEKKFELLLRRIRGLRPVRGDNVEPQYSNYSETIEEEPTDSWQSDNVRELLLGNLLEVQMLPTNIWYAKTEFTNSRDIFVQEKDVEAHILRENKLWSFANLKEAGCKLQQYIDYKTIDKIDVVKWIGDDVKELNLKELMNKCLTSHLSKLAIKKEAKGRYFFRPGQDGTPRVWQNGNDRARTVASKKTNPITGSEFWVHHAARIRFLKFGTKFFLCIEPTFLFTSEGETPLEGQQMGRLSFAWGGMQKNPDILRNVVFWIKAIAGNKQEIQIYTSGEPLMIKAIPSLTTANNGIEEDYIKIKSLLNSEDTELDEAANDVELVEKDEDEEEL